MDSKKWYLSKTLWASVISFALGIIALVDSHFGTTLTSQAWYGFVLSLAGMLGIGGRITSSTTLTK